MSLPWKFDTLGVMGGLAPISGTRGVFLTSAGVDVSSAMVVSGGTIGTGYNADAALVLRRGRSVSQTIAAGGCMFVSSGGVSFNALTISGGSILVFRGGSAFGFAGNGTLRVSAGGVAISGVISASFISNFGEVANFTITYGGINVNAGTMHDCITSRATVTVYSALVADHIMRGGTMALKQGASITSGVVVSDGVLNVSSGIASDTTVSSGASAVVSSGGIASHFTSVDGATVQVLSGGSATTNGTAYGVSVAEGGALTVESGGLALNVTAENPADVVVIDGGTVYPPLT